MRRRAEEDYDYGVPPCVGIGEIGLIPHPFELSREEQAALEQEIAEKLKRKRPIGFVRWPQEEGEVADSERGCGGGSAGTSDTTPKQRTVSRAPSRGRTNTRRKAG